jgi:hypothetical protein
VLGPERALQLIGSQGAEALILVREDGEIVEHATKGWEVLVRPE